MLPKSVIGFIRVAVLYQSHEILVIRTVISYAIEYHLQVQRVLAEP